MWKIFSTVLRMVNFPFQEVKYLFVLLNKRFKNKIAQKLMSSQQKLGKMDISILLKPRAKDMQNFVLNILKIGATSPI